MNAFLVNSGGSSWMMNAAPSASIDRGGAFGRRQQVGLLASIFPGHDVAAFKNALASYLMDDAPAALASMQAESKKPTHNNE